MKNKIVLWIVSFAVVLAFVVVTLGAYTRLTEAGLGCPDWPGCYGQLVLPEEGINLDHAQMSYPLLPIETQKAWTEMTHRYVAGSLGLIVVGLVFLAFRRRQQREEFPFCVPIFLALLIFFQAALGMWTVTLKLLPTVVMGHLLGGMSILALLWWLCLDLSIQCDGSSPVTEQDKYVKIKPWVVVGLILLCCQIALGGWVSSNYAGISCVGFPLCNGKMFPHLDFKNGFNLFSPIGINYQGGVLGSAARMAIQMVHRIGAVISTSYLIILVLYILKKPRLSALTTPAIVVMVLICIQFTLGVINVVKLLPLGVAVAHNGVAALTLLAVLTLFFYTNLLANTGNITK